MKPEVGMRVRLNAPNPYDYAEPSKNGVLGIIEKPGFNYAGDQTWFVLWDDYPDAHYNYSPRVLQFLREK
jgi:hypothetical protein